jgi:hypothetical protein
MKIKLSKKMLWCFGLFATICLVYCLLIKTWFFEGEDYFALYRMSLVHSWSDFLDLFIHGNVAWTWGTTTGKLPPCPSVDILSVCYRPLLLFWYFIEYHCFGLNAYAYFVTSIALHASIATLLFYYLSSMGNIILALLCSLFFAFHPTLDFWLGKVDFQQHHIALFLIFLSLACLKKYIDSDKKTYRILAMLCFFLALATREIWVVFPFIAWGLLSIFPSMFFQKQPPYAERIKIIMQLIGLIGLYCLFRTLAYPPHLSTPLLTSGINPQPLLITVKNWLFTFAEGAYYTFLLWWYPWSAYYFFQAYNLLTVFRLLKLLLVGITAYLVIVNPHKKTVLYLTFFIALLYWPLLFRSNHRFFYESLPFISIVLFLLLQPLFRHKIKALLIGTALTILIVINGIHVTKNVQKACLFKKITHDAILSLKQAMPVKPHISCALFFKGVSSKLVPEGFTHAVLLRGILNAPTLYFVQQVNMHADDAALNDNLLITHQPRGLRLQTRNPAKLWFSINKDWTTVPPWTIIHQQDSSGRIFDLSLIVEERSPSQNIEIFMWKETMQRFIRLS